MTIAFGNHNRIQDTPLADKLFDLAEQYSPPLLCRHYIPSCTFGLIKGGRRSGHIDYHRTSLELEGSGSPGICNLDIAYSSNPSSKSIILIPGVTGDSGDNYVMDLAHEGLAKGYNMIVFNHTATKKDTANNLKLIDIHKGS